ncbi:hypothetical protein Pan216_26880 [Planctomycetes bacterium Pan216]|uniref:Uncharacterized protein n=1 Tax=Kolteria novifilia TaxID=2527975 RepID=A0A518B497_9BACT|nr:hypothetical protein Pan216_26880 [Planctomycetes bacterium Pan216]
MASFNPAQLIELLQSMANSKRMVADMGAPLEKVREVEKLFQQQQAEVLEALRSIEVPEPQAAKLPNVEEMTAAMSEEDRQKVLSQVPPEYHEMEDLEAEQIAQYQSLRAIGENPELADVEGAAAKRFAEEHDWRSYGTRSSRREEESTLQPLEIPDWVHDSGSILSVVRPATPGTTSTDAAASPIGESGANSSMDLPDSVNLHESWAAWLCSSQSLFEAQSREEPSDPKADEDSRWTDFFK